MPDDFKNDRPIKVGVSACLLGEHVRYDGGHKHDRYLTDVLGRFFKFVMVCPEVEVGMGVPREAVQLRGIADDPNMVGSKSGKDWTEIVNSFNAQRAAKLEAENLSGYILKKNSPSCGMERVKVYNSKGMAERKAAGLWGAALIKRFPLLPIEEEGRLNDARLRDNFIVRVFAYSRLHNLFNGKYNRGNMVEFHTAHKLLMMAHSPKHYTQLGKLVADVKNVPAAKMRDEYSLLFMEGLKVKSTVKKNVNVLYHILGYLKKQLETGDKQDIIRVIEDYHHELTPLIVPITLLKHYIEKHNIEYIKNQIYLNPHPKELMLRNHV